MRTLAFPAWISPHFLVVSLDSPESDSFSGMPLSLLLRFKAHLTCQSFTFRMSPNPTMVLYHIGVTQEDSTLTCCLPAEGLGQAYAYLMQTNFYAHRRNALPAVWFLETWNPYTPSASDSSVPKCSKGYIGNGWSLSFKTATGCYFLAVLPLLSLLGMFECKLFIKTASLITVPVVCS